MLAMIGGDGSVDGVPDALFDALGAATALSVSSTTTLKLFRWRTPHPHLQFDGAKLATCEPPVLLVWGQDDKVQPPAAGEWAARQVPRGRLEVLPGVTACTSVRRSRAASCSPSSCTRQSEENSMTRDQAEPMNNRAEHEIFTRRFLAAYDAVILGFYLRWVWRCPRSVLTDQYRAHTGRRHLDVGPGTGYFLDVADLSTETAITLLDPNPEVLDHAARRLTGRSPTTVRADACQPLPITGSFDSAALNLVLHCIAGADRKAAAIRNVAATLDEDGVLFGASVLGAPDVHRRLGLVTLTALNRRGSFANLDDTEAVLSDLLHATFGHVALAKVGAVAVFTARQPTVRSSAADPGGLSPHRDGPHLDQRAQARPRTVNLGRGLLESSPPETSSASTAPGSLDT
jgi:SAM-dependent methyltransferase